MKLSNYRITPAKTWTGRIDDPEDPDSFRMHQIVNNVNLEELEKITFNSSRLNICFLGFCSDEGVSRNLGRLGTKKGPQRIRQQFANLPVTFGSKALLYDAGDIWCDDGNLEEAQEQLSEAVKIILDNNLFPIVLGGGHALALGNYKGVVKHLDQRFANNSAPAIINFDAHLDMRPYQNGGTSGTMFYQIADLCQQEQRPYSYMCLGTQTYANTISLFKRADELGAKYIHAKDMQKVHYPEVLGKIYNYIDKHEHIYVTICSDVFNSSAAPGVSALQPFGLDPEVALTFIKQILRTDKVICFDIAEVSPRFDMDSHTAKLAAVIIFAVINALLNKEE